MNEITSYALIVAAAGAAALASTHEILLVIDHLLAGLRAAPFLESVRFPRP